jgi:hypothetical protein
MRAVADGVSVVAATALTVLGTIAAKCYDFADRAAASQTVLADYRCRVLQP